ncbi:hypothetical protein K440DRAFT_659692 [Wilcoxina mikolae CBS 423.85]|nr:hypothetical protein K440DRAFT_659692 [Wilcoxina mikolae CBS 423.85]
MDLSDRTPNNRTPNNTLPPLRPYVHGAWDPAVGLPPRGSVIIIRLPFSMPGPASVISSSAVSGATRYNYHLCIVINSMGGFHDWELDVFVCRSFSEQLDPISYVSGLDQLTSKYLIPLHWDPALPTPAVFGAPLSLPDYIPRRATWVIASSCHINMGGNSQYKLFNPRVAITRQELNRLITYSRTMGSAPASLIVPVPGPGGPTMMGGMMGGADVGATGSLGAGTNTGEGDSHPPTPAGNNGVTYDQGHTLYACQDDDDDYDDDDGSFNNLPIEDFIMSIAPTLPYSIKLRERRQAEQNDRIVQWIRSM